MDTFNNNIISKNKVTHESCRITPTQILDDNSVTNIVISNSPIQVSFCITSAKFERSINIRNSVQLYVTRSGSNSLEASGARLNSFELNEIFMCYLLLRRPLWTHLRNSIILYIEGNSFLLQLTQAPQYYRAPWYSEGHPASLDWPQGDPWKYKENSDIFTHGP